MLTHAAETNSLVQRLAPLFQGGFSRPLARPSAATWDTFRRWDIRSPQFNTTIYGGGGRFTEGVQYLDRIFTALGGTREVHYFGNLDAAGLRIPCMTSEKADLNWLGPSPSGSCPPQIRTYRTGVAGLGRTCPSR